MRKVFFVAGIMLGALLMGCTGTDKALPIELGEPMTETKTQEDEKTKASGEAASSYEEPVNLYVYVCGAVKCPGVVVLPEGSRCGDALEAAGGFAEDAAREVVNLAELLSDGVKLYFPTREEAETMAEDGQETDTGLVNINTAGESLLCTLPGIGEAKAGAIVSYREEHGEFDTVEGIMQVPGIKESAYSQIKDLITVK